MNDNGVTVHGWDKTPQPTNPGNRVAVSEFLYITLLDPFLCTPTDVNRPVCLMPKTTLLPMIQHAVPIPSLDDIDMVENHLVVCQPLRGSLSVSGVGDNQLLETIIRWSKHGLGV